MHHGFLFVLLSFLDVVASTSSPKRGNTDAFTWQSLTLEAHSTRYLAQLLPSVIKLLGHTSNN